MTATRGVEIFSESFLHCGVVSGYCVDFHKFINRLGRGCVIIPIPVQVNRLSQQIRRILRLTELQTSVLRFH